MELHRVQHCPYPAQRDRGERGTEIKEDQDWQKMSIAWMSVHTGFGIEVSDVFQELPAGHEATLKRACLAGNLGVESMVPNRANRFIVNVFEAERPHVRG